MGSQWFSQYAKVQQRIAHHNIYKLFNVATIRPIKYSSNVPYFRGHTTLLQVRILVRFAEAKHGLLKICIAFNTDNFFWSCYNLICQVSLCIERRIPRIAHLVSRVWEWGREGGGDTARYLTTWFL